MEPLQFLTISHYKTQIFALIDGVAQINLIEQNLFKYLQYSECESEIKKVTGINGAAVCISQWVKICLNLKNRKTVQTAAAICSQLPCGFILGLPFLKQVKAKQDFDSGFLQTSVGILQISAA